MLFTLADQRLGEHFCFHFTTNRTSKTFLHLKDGSPPSQDCQLCFSQPDVLEALPPSAPSDPVSVHSHLSNSHLLSQQVVPGRLICFCFYLLLALATFVTTTQKRVFFSFLFLIQFSSKKYYLFRQLCQSRMKN